MILNLNRYDNLLSVSMIQSSTMKPAEVIAYWER